MASQANSARTVRTSVGDSAQTTLILVVVCAAIYGGLLALTGFLPTIPGVTWLRPANMLSELFGVCFGPWGAVAVAVGNSLGDLLHGQLNLATLWWVVPIEFVFTAWVVYFGVTDPSLRTPRGKAEWAFWAVLVQGLGTGFGIAFFLCYVSRLAPEGAFSTIGTTIALNEAIPAIFAGLIQYALFPRVVRMGLWMGRNLEKSNVPKDLLAELMR